uniref:septin and tuftelin-interacting protein 1 homolog 1-like n=1 Tax=Erigeron canadensis TaxID=72917 RepID=UPI001CB8C59A|nr:septin and tuftelin-interacting protein 1 homolog 1-like [Erigeron canadensis]XP_043636105.1 septin and tuftelin-interacting protein 1 homolog 1-like [Erigeron canadensis]
MVYEDGQSSDRKRKEKSLPQSKDDAIYGVFAYSNSDSDSEGRGSKKKQRRDLSGKQDYTKPLNFVTPSQEENAKDNGSPSGLDIDRVQEEEANSKIVESFLKEFDKALKEGELQIMEKLKLKRESCEVAGPGTREGNSVGMKMLEKMGYKGGGLGKNEQGIVEPIEAQIRPKKMGLGFNEAANYGQKLLKENNVLPPQPTEVQPKWSKQGRSEKKKKEYVTAEELLVNKPRLVEKLIDMRGPQVRVLTSLENLNDEVKPEEKDDILPELQHNVTLIVNLGELDVQKIDRYLRNERETVVSLQQQKAKLEDNTARQAKQLDSMEEILTVLDQLDKESRLGTLTLDSLIKSFGNLQKRFSDEYRVRSLSRVACSYALPLFSRLFQGWDPLIKPMDNLDVISLWKEFLQADERSDSPYPGLFMKVMFPHIWKSITKTWQVKHPEPLLRFLNIWERLLPHSALKTILDDIVLPNLSAAVDSWNPRWDTIPIHIWVHPWLAWKSVFDLTSWEHLIRRSITPKLLAVMHEFRVNILDPSDKNLDKFNWVQTWAGVIPIHYMVRIMDAFFDKWQDVLYQWLSSKPSIEEVMNWYQRWMDVIPPKLLSNEHIQVRLKVGLCMIKQASEGLQVVQPGFIENQRHYQAQQKAAASFDTSYMGVMSLKEVIEEHAQHNDVLFKPKPGRMQDGHQVYGFGNVNIIIDSLKEKVFAQTEGKWSLTTLEQLVKMEKNCVLSRC